MTTMSWFLVIITITQFWRALEIFIAYDFSCMTHQYNLCLRRSRSYKLHWRAMNKKFRAINNYLTNYDYNSFCLQKLRRELKKKNHASSWAFYLQGAIERLFVDANSDTLQVEFQPESNVNPKSTEQKLALKTATPKLH